MRDIALETSGGRDTRRQHLIDPETCIRCNTCEETCPVDAITHDGRNYVVDPMKCASCLACIAPCPTGAIDNWRTLPPAEAYPVEEQLGWDALPTEKPPDACVTGAAVLSISLLTLLWLQPTPSVEIPKAEPSSITAQEPTLRATRPSPRSS